MRSARSESRRCTLARLHGARPAAQPESALCGALKSPQASRDSAQPAGAAAPPPLAQSAGGAPGLVSEGLPDSDCAGDRHTPSHSHNVTRRARTQARAQKVAGQAAGMHSRRRHCVLRTARTALAESARAGCGAAPVHKGVCSQRSDGRPLRAARGFRPTIRGALRRRRSRAHRLGPAQFDIKAAQKRGRSAAERGHGLRGKPPSVRMVAGEPGVFQPHCH